MLAKNVVSLVLATAFMLNGAVVPGMAASKKWTVTERQEALSKDIDKAYKANQLTLKERDDLKSTQQKISDRISSMQKKNGGKLSYDDNRKLEKDLNGVSVKLQKRILEKRVAK
jgi:hypothetical protein